MCSGIESDSSRAGDMIRSAFLLLVLLLGASGTAARAQDAPRSSSPTELVGEARHWSARGDTTMALALLRRAVEAEPNHPDAVFALGTLLARTAPTEERDFRQRAEAEHLLDHAYRLRGGDPAVLIELGLLKRKQNIRVDSRRLLEEGLRGESGSEVDSRRIAEAHYALARILEEELFEVEHLLFLGPSFRQFGSASADPLGGGASSAICPAGVTFFCYNYTRPRDFNLLFEEVASPASDTPQDLYPRIEDHYRSALSHDPRHEMAARGLMALYLRRDRVAEFAALAEELVDLDPDRPFPRLFLGLARAREERWLEAERAFDEGLRRLPPTEREAFHDVTALLKSDQRSVYAALEDHEQREYEDVLWAKSDPLYLIPGNERRLEHVARVTYAELHFGNPERGQRGWESDRGLVHIRWGPPRKIWKIGLGDRLSQQGGGRYVLWNYRIDAPSFIFFSQAGYETVRFDQGANTAEYVRGLAESESASVFRSRAVTTWIELPHQLARFKGSGPNLTRVVAWVEADPRRFLLFDGDSVATALFLFSPGHRDTVEIRQTIPAGASGNLAFTLEAFPATYEFAVEGYAAGSRVAGTERGTLEIAGFPPGQLSLSDLVVADGVAPRNAQPVRWSDFSIAASRDLAFRPDEEIHLYFEIYGLETDGDGDAAYRLELTVEDVSEQGLVGSVVRSLGNLVGLGEDQETRILFDRTARPREDVVPEYLSLALPDVEPGAYTIRVTVDDRSGERFATLSRTITIEER